MGEVRIYDVPAEGYEELYGSEQLEKYELITLNIGDRVSKIGSILDVGCATCLFGDYLREVGYRGLYIGLDIDLERLEYARRKAGRDFMLIQADANHLPVRDKSIDFAVCITAIHLLDVERALCEMIRASRWLTVVTLLRKRLDLKPRILETLSRLGAGWALRGISIQRIKDEVFILERCWAGPPQSSWREPEPIPRE